MTDLIVALNSKSPRYWAAAYYLLIFGAGGTLVPYLNLHYQQNGLDTRQIGILAALQPIVIVFASPLWGGIADLFRLHRGLLVFAMIASLPCALLLGTVHTFVAFVFAVLIFALCSAPIMPLGDNAVLELLGTQRYDYGKLRLWGAVGWGLAAWLGGELIGHHGMSLGFGGYITLTALCSLVSLRLPAPRSSCSEPYWRGLGRMLANVRWLGFLLGVFVASVAYAILDNYFILYLKGLGISEGLFGLSLAFGSVSEIVIFLLTPWLLRKVAPRGLLLFSIVMISVRGLVYSWVADPRWALGAQLLHGPTFSAMWTAGVSYSNEIAPKGMGASAQAIFGATQFGLATAVGAILGGQLYGLIGPVDLFRVAAVIALLAAVIFSVTEFSRGAESRLSKIIRSWSCRSTR